MDDDEKDEYLGITQRLLNEYNTKFDYLTIKCVLAGVSYRIY